MLQHRATFVSALVFLCAACGGGLGGSAASPVVAFAASIAPTVTAPMPTPAPSATPTVPPTVVQSPLALSNGVVQLDPIPSNFDTAVEMEPMGIPGTMAPDEVGAFRMTCKASHNAYDDPIVYPGQPGAAHLHTFFGNTQADAYSTYASLRTSGDSTCHSKLNRSAYWVPAMMNGRGQVVMPDFLSVYYKRWPAGSAMCRQVGTCIPIPRGLRMVFGRKMTGEVSANPIERNAVHFNCAGPGAVGGIYASIAEAAKNCPSGAQIGAVTNAPQCWNGTQLDSPDHRSHMAYFIYDAQNLIRCPATHPYVMPDFTLSAWYTTDETLDRTGSTDPTVQTWHFSSDRMPGMAAKASGETFHADWFGAWDDNALATWTANCIDKLLSCTTGNMGNGTGMKWLAGFNFKAEPRLVNPPIRITTAMLCTGKRRLKPAEQKMIQAIRRKLDAASSKSVMMASVKSNSMNNIGPAHGVA